LTKCPGENYPTRSEKYPTRSETYPTISKKLSILSALVSRTRRAAKDSSQQEIRISNFASNVALSGGHDADDEQEEDDEEEDEDSVFAQVVIGPAASIDEGKEQKPQKQQRPQPPAHLLLSPRRQPAQLLQPPPAHGGRGRRASLSPCREGGGTFGQSSSIDLGATAQQRQRHLRFLRAVHSAKTRLSRELSEASAGKEARSLDSADNSLHVPGVNPARPQTLGFAPLKKSASEEDDEGDENSIGGLGKRIRKLSSRTIEFCDSIDNDKPTPSPAVKTKSRLPTSSAGTLKVTTPGGTEEIVVDETSIGMGNELARPPGGRGEGDHPVGSTVMQLGALGFGGQPEQLQQQRQHHATTVPSIQEPRQRQEDVQKHYHQRPSGFSQSIDSDVSHESASTVVTNTTFTQERQRGSAPMAAAARPERRLPQQPQQTSSGSAPTSHLTGSLTGALTSLASSLMSMRNRSGSSSAGEFSGLRPQRRQQPDPDSRERPLTLADAEVAAVTGYGRQRARPPQHQSSAGTPPQGLPRRGALHSRLAQRLADRCHSDGSSGSSQSQSFGSLDFVTPPSIVCTAEGAGGTGDSGSSQATPHGINSSLDDPTTADTPVMDEFAQFLNASIHPPNELSVPRCYPAAPTDCPASPSLLLPMSMPGECSKMHHTVAEGKSAEEKGREENWKGLRRANANFAAKCRGITSSSVILLLLATVLLHPSQLPSTSGCSSPPHLSQLFPSFAFPLFSVWLTFFLKS